MKKVEKISYEYVTNDGKIFESEQKALEHEQELLRWEIEKREVKIGEGDFTIFKIENKEELEAIIAGADWGDNIEQIKYVFLFPCFIGKYYIAEYGYGYELVDSVINKYELMIKKLKTAVNEYPY